MQQLRSLCSKRVQAGGSSSRGAALAGPSDDKENHAPAANVARAGSKSAPGAQKASSAAGKESACLGAPSALLPCGPSPGTSTGAVQGSQPVRPVRASATKAQHKIALSLAAAPPASAASSGAAVGGSGAGIVSGGGGGGGEGRGDGSAGGRGAGEHAGGSGAGGGARSGAAGPGNGSAGGSGAAGNDGQELDEVDAGILARCCAENLRAPEKMDNDYFEVRVSVKALPAASDFYTLGGFQQPLGRSCLRWRQRGKPYVQVASEPILVLAKLNGREAGPLSGLGFGQRKLVVDLLNADGRVLVQMAPPETRGTLIGRHQTVSGIELCEALQGAGVREVVLVRYGHKTRWRVVDEMFRRWAAAGPISPEPEPSLDLRLMVDYINRADWGVNLARPGYAIALLHAKRGPSSRTHDAPYEDHAGCTVPAPLQQLRLKSLEVWPVMISMSPAWMHEYGTLRLSFKKPEVPPLQGGPRFWLERLIIYSRHMHIVKSVTGVSDWGKMPRSVGGLRGRVDLLRRCLSAITTAAAQAEPDTTLGIRIEGRFAGYGFPSAHMAAEAGLTSIETASDFLVQHGILEAPGITESSVDVRLLTAVAHHQLACIEELKALRGSDRQKPQLRQADLVADLQSTLGLYYASLKPSYGRSEWLWCAPERLMRFQASGAPAPSRPAGGGDPYALGEDEPGSPKERLRNNPAPDAGLVQLLHEVQAYRNPRQRAEETSQDEAVRQLAKVKEHIVKRAQLVPHPKVKKGPPRVTFQQYWWVDQRFLNGGFAPSCLSAWDVADYAVERLRQANIDPKDWWKIRPDVEGKARAPIDSAAGSQNLIGRFADANKAYVDALREARGLPKLTDAEVKQKQNEKKEQQQQQQQQKEQHARSKSGDESQGGDGSNSEETDEAMLTPAQRLHRLREKFQVLCHRKYLGREQRDGDCGDDDDDGGDDDDDEEDGNNGHDSPVGSDYDE